MTGEGFIIAGTICIVIAAVILILSITWIRGRKKELRKQWEI